MPYVIFQKNEKIILHQLIQLLPLMTQIYKVVPLFHFSNDRNLLITLIYIYNYCDFNILNSAKNDIFFNQIKVSFGYEI